MIVVGRYETSFSIDSNNSKFELLNSKDLASLKAKSALLIPNLLPKLNIPGFGSLTTSFPYTWEGSSRIHL